MEVTVDAAGRIAIPEALRYEVGFLPGSVVDVSRSGADLVLERGGPTARIVEENGRLVVAGTTVVTDGMVRALLEAGLK